MTENSRRSPGGESTLDDVARRAGVSLATASRVLNGSARTVTESYRQRVESAALELGYTANLSAQAVARGTGNALTLLVADIADPYFGQITAGVSRAAAESGVTLTIAVTGRDPARELAQVRALRGQHPRAIILVTSRIGDRMPTDLENEIVRMRRAGTRVVAFGHGAGMLPAVHVDNEGGARALGRALAARGYERAVVLAAAEGVRTSDARVAGFTAGFDARGGIVRAIYRGDFSRAAGAAAMATALRDGVADRGTLVFAVSDIVALGAMAGARKAGRVIGRDVAFAGFDDIPGASDVTPALTTVRVALERLGHRAALAALSGDVPAKPESVEVVLRESSPDLR